MPRCIIVTGPGHADKVSWLHETTHAIQAEQPSTHYAVLSVNKDAIGMERFAQAARGVTIRRLFLPCKCCPAAADLPRHVHTATEAIDVDWVSLMLSVLAATGLIAEFDALVCWPREVVVCLGPDWTEARRADTLSFFQFRLITSANRVIESRTKSDKWLQF